MIVAPGSCRSLYELCTTCVRGQRLLFLVQRVNIRECGWPIPPRLPSVWTRLLARLPRRGRHEAQGAERGWVGKLDELNEAEVIEEFQRRRGKHLRKSIPALVLIVAGFAGALFEGRLSVPDPDRFGMAFLAAGIGIAWWSLLTFRGGYRCPSCKSVPISWMRDGRWGVQLNPSVCHECGTRLS